MQSGSSEAAGSGAKLGGRGRPAVMQVACALRASASAPETRSSCTYLLFKHADARPHPGMRATTVGVEIPAHRWHDRGEGSRSEASEVPPAGVSVLLLVPERASGRHWPYDHWGGPRHPCGPCLESFCRCPGHRPSAPHRAAKGGGRLPPYRLWCYRGQDVPVAGLQAWSLQDLPRAGAAGPFLHAQAAEAALRAAQPVHLHAVSDGRADRG
mmetsp:Transcript_125227/g.267317  ORF Transcript_125227/g.267317 Transcript_125227/m.267317 type:complete len:212 (+) Transcript_125227:3517-4152(+)